METRRITEADKVAAENLRRIWDARKKELGLTQEKAGHEMGMSQGAVGHYLRGRIALGTDAVLKFAALLHVYPDEIRPDVFSIKNMVLRADGEPETELTGNPPKDFDIVLNGLSQDELQKALMLLKEFVLVPRYNVAASMGGGAPVHSEQVVDYLSFKREWVIHHLKLDPTKLALIDSRGDSMMPTIKPDDLLLVDLTETQKLRDGIYVIQIDGELLAKRIERQIDGSIIIRSDNSAKYPTTQAVKSEDTRSIKVIGRVVWSGGRIL